MYPDGGFDWDEANIQHIARHDIEPAEAEQVILNNPIELEGRQVNGEDRILSLGITNQGRLLLVATTMRGHRLRVVTAFKAPKQMVLEYIRERGL